MSDLTPKTYAEWLAELLAKLRNTIDGVSTGQASDARLRAEVIASILEGQSQYLDWSIDQRFPDTANDTNLERHAGIYDLERKDPTTSEGSVTITGTPGSTQASGSTFTDAEGNEGETSELATIPGGGSVTVDAVSTDTGTAVNWASAEELTLSSPDPGIDADCTAAEDFTGGTDTETSAALLERLLNRIQNPPAGGTESDWEQWAEAVDGVLHAFTHPQRRGAGTIDVSIVTEGPGGHLALPGAALLTSVETYLESVRPVTTKDFEVIAPDQVLQAVTVDDVDADTGYDADTVVDDIEDAIEAFFDTLETGDTLIWNDLHTAINSVDGVANFTLTTPAADVTATVDSATAELLMPGVITVNKST